MYSPEIAVEEVEPFDEDDDSIIDSYIGTSNLKETSVVPIKYKVSFDANGGAGTMSDVTDLRGTYTLPENEFDAPSGKQFKGWSLTSDGEIITTLEMTENKVVYAIWEDIPEEAVTPSDENEAPEETVTPNDENEATIKNEDDITINNPKTGDNITLWISLMVISILGVVGTVKFVKKNK